MQTWYQYHTVHPDILHARVCGARGAPVLDRCTPTPSGAAGQAVFSAEHPGIPANPYWISVLILNLDLTFQFGTPPTCIILSFIIRRGGGMNTRVSFVFVGGGECQPPNYSRYSRVIREYSPDSRAQRMPTYTYDEA